MSGKSIRRGWDERGQSIVEMAIALPLLLLLTMAVVDFGRAYNNYIVVTNASREGARFGSRFPQNLDGIRGAALLEASNSGIPLAAGNVTRTFPRGSSAAGFPISVTVTYSFPTILGGIAGFDTLTLRRTTQMVIFGLDS